MFLERFRKKINAQQRISLTMSDILIQYNNNVTREVYVYAHAVKIALNGIRSFLME
jgi:hypothetical protein